MASDWQRVDAIFSETLDVPVDQRATWLAERCGDDAQLRIDVETLLRAEARSGDFLEKPAHIPADDEMPAAFGAYRVIRKIGQGGMGEVFLAERSDGEFEQRVAIKQLAYPTPGLLARFRQERRILARLEHPNIARLIDGGVDARGAPYFVMEYVDGVPIDRFADEHGLKLRERLGLFLDACEAIQFAHQHLVVHRDLKPSNILVATDGKPKLLDFGIAKTLADDDSLATRTAARLLTPDYAAPEQLRGDAINTATDVYALGVILYELLSGTRPPARAALHREIDVPPPSAVTNGTIASRELRGDMDRVVMKAIERDPQRRYLSVDAFAADIRRHLVGQPVSVRADSALYVLRTFVRRNRVAVAAAVVVLSTIVAGSVAVLVEAHQARIAATRAQAQAQRAQASQQFLIGMFDRLDPESSHGKAISAHDLLDSGAKLLEERKDDPPDLKAELASTMVNLYFDIGDYSRTLELAKAAVAMNDEPGVPKLAQARNLQNLGGLEYRDFKYDDALSHFEKGLDLAKSSSPDEDTEERRAETIGRLEAQIAMTLNVKGDSTRAESMMRAALAGDREKNGDGSRIVADDWDELGQVLHSLRRFEESRTAFDRSAAIYRALGNEPMLAAVDLDLGKMLDDANLADDAENVLRESLDISTRVLGANHRDTMLTLDSLATTIEMKGRFDEAAAMRRRILEQTRTTFGETSAQTAVAYESLGHNLIAQSHISEAVGMFRKAVACNVAVFGEESVGTSIARYALGEALMIGGHYDDAQREVGNSLAMMKRLNPNAGDTSETEFRELLIAEIDRRAQRSHQAVEELGVLVPKLQKTLGESDPTTNYAMTELGWAQLDAGDTDAALATMQRAVADARAAFAPDNYRLASPMIVLGRALVADGRAADAEPMLREAKKAYADAFGANHHAVVAANVALAEALLAQGKREEARRLVDNVPAQLSTSEQDDTQLRARAIAVIAGKPVSVTKRTDVASRDRHAG
jgi:serine/threonine-protein kinase